ncbi:MAG: hypothetical protein MJE12_05555 [Alphaproteobacteria bacterium]|nr:hypothetical protein [Alphaproteobacteria bacterium]
MAKSSRNDGPSKKGKGASETASRRHRQAAQLRENLLKRKAQGRRRTEETGENKGASKDDADR